MKHKKIIELGWPQRILFGIGIFVFFFAFSKLTVAFITKQEKENDGVGKYHKHLVVNFLTKVIGIAIILIGLYLSLSFMGLDMSTILIFLGSAGLGIALALKDFITSCVNGIIIITLDYYKVGDIVQYGDLLGKVSSFDLINTIIKDSDDISHIIPNSKIVEDGYVSYSKNEKIGVNAEACISNTDPNLNVQKLLDELKEEIKNKDYNNSDESWSYISDMNENGTIIGCGYSIKAENYFSGMSLLKLRLRNFMRKKGVLMCTSSNKYLESVYVQVKEEE